jgi:replicative DNA helicase
MSGSCIVADGCEKPFFSQEINAVTTSHKASPPHLEPVPICALTASLLETLRTRYGAREAGVRTGFYDLDEMLGALRPGSITVVTGAPAAGKTTLALCIAASAAKIGNPTAIVSNKLAAADLAQRLLAIIGRIDGVKLRDGRLSENDWAAVDAAAAILQRLPLHIADHVTTIGQFTEIIDVLTERVPPTMIVIDRIDLLTTSADVPAVINILRTIATHRSCSVIATTNMSEGQATESADPLMQLAELVDATISLELETLTTQLTPTLVHVSRNRFGPTGTARLLRDASVPAFMSCVRSPAR